MVSKFLWPRISLMQILKAFITIISTITINASVTCAYLKVRNIRFLENLTYLRFAFLPYYRRTVPLWILWDYLTKINASPFAGLGVFATTSFHLFFKSLLLCLSYSLMHIWLSCLITELFFKINVNYARNVDLLQILMLILNVPSVGSNFLWYCCIISHKEGKI